MQMKGRGGAIWAWFRRGRGLALNCDGTAGQGAWLSRGGGRDETAHLRDVTAMAALGRLLPLLLLLPAASAEPRPGPSGLPVPGPCWLPKAVGRCRAAVPRFWFNSTSGSCQAFTYGGCDGNANNFATERECRESCAPLRSLPGPSTASSYAEHCLAPAQTGPCRAAFPRWFYSPRDGACRRFIYGGCQGNRNNYGSREECWKRCGRGER
ncbi:kunitz-type protease inhibitor 2-like, partial [Neopsephotus bourkii]|uniref:kunitz-type protease inhibitor 2-like n=1 Tax=Neopsephotus bourkii TaxID=309878 RepID=UPI002AA52F1C